MGRWRLSMTHKHTHGLVKHTRAVIALVLLGLALALASCDSNPERGPTPTAVSVENPTPTSLTPVSQGTPLELVQVPTVLATPTLDLISPPLSPVSPSAPKTKVTIALGYNPDVQFTPFYVALNKGYYAEEGLDVSFKHGTVPDMMKLLAAGQGGVNFAVASGDEVIPARINGLPVLYVMTWYR